VFKVAMIEVDRALRTTAELDCYMLLTVHDELVFEVPESNVEEAAELVRGRMEQAVDLEVPLLADVGWGPDWSAAAPIGH
jgi:DNA polymerase-1